ncbi:hypothetical protein NTH_04088 [Nitratireductor thuwali]|uniref:Uncharacterized protein n=1 Tax=Nitratireductor thuwali TaxID=2267699 RepID=A0ABY5MNL7_9HYPH|nr:hypothetical protein NTH_04088 [Nitratireductor thuwali]
MVALSTAIAGAAHLAETARDMEADACTLASSTSSRLTQ